MAIDLDDLLAYTTTRRVRVRHARVGGLYYSIIIAICAYTIGYRVVYKKGYERLIPLTGAVRATVAPPAALEPVDALAYCSQSGRTGAAVQYPCAYPDMESGALIRITPGDEGALLVGTRLSVITQHRSACNESDYACMPWTPDASVAKEGVEKRTQFVGDVEGCTIMLQHSVSHASQQAYGVTEIVDSFDADRPTAMLRSADGERAAEVRKGPFGDIFNISDLLYVGGVDLDATTNRSTPTNVTTVSSYRKDGMTLRLRVVYSAPSLSWRTTRYDYVVGINRIEAKLVTNDLLGENVTVRRLHDLHGVQLLFSQEGSLRVFDFPTLMLSIISGIAFVATAKTLVDCYLLYLAPKRRDYRLFVEASTPDFSPDSQSEALVLNQVLERKRWKQAVLMGRGGSDAPGAAWHEAGPRGPLAEPFHTPLHAGHISVAAAPATADPRFAPEFAPTPAGGAGVNPVNTR